MDRAASRVERRVSHARSLALTLALLGSAGCGPSEPRVNDPSTAPSGADAEMSPARRLALSLSPDSEEGRAAWRAYRKEVLTERLAAFENDGDCVSARAFVETMDDLAGAPIYKIPSAKELGCEGTSCGPTLDSLGWRHAADAPIVDLRLRALGDSLFECRAGPELEKFWTTLGEPDLATLAVGHEDDLLVLLQGSDPLSDAMTEALTRAWNASPRKVGCAAAMQELERFEKNPPAIERKAVRTLIHKQFARACDPPSKLAALYASDPTERAVACLVLKADGLVGVPDSALEEMSRLEAFDDARSVGASFSAFGSSDSGSSGGSGRSSSIDPPAFLALPLLPVMVLQGLGGGGGGGDGGFSLPVRRACTVPSEAKRPSNREVGGRFEITHAQAETTNDRVNLSYFGPPTQFVIRVERADRQVECFSTGTPPKLVDWGAGLTSHAEAGCSEWGHATLTADQVDVPALMDMERHFMRYGAPGEAPKDSRGRRILAGIAGHREAELELPRSSPLARTLTIVAVPWRSGPKFTDPQKVRLDAIPKSP